MMLQYQSQSLLFCFFYWICHVLSHKFRENPNDYHWILTVTIWASARENLSSGVCKQHRRRPACASAQSDQRLCYSLSGKYHMWTCSRWNFNFLTSPCNWADWFETRFVGNPEDRFCRDEAHIMSNLWEAWYHENSFRRPSIY